MTVTESEGPETVRERMILDIEGERVIIDCEGE